MILIQNRLVFTIKMNQESYDVLLIGEEKIIQNAKTLQNNSARFLLFVLHPIRFYDKMIL